MGIKITYIGHSCFMIEGTKSIIIDPFLSGNPDASIKPDEIECNYILVTHGHADHLGDAIGISKRTGAVIVAPYELATYCQMQGDNSLYFAHINNFSNSPGKHSPKIFCVFRILENQSGLYIFITVPSA